VDKWGVEFIHFKKLNRFKIQCQEKKDPPKERPSRKERLLERRLCVELAEPERLLERKRLLDARLLESLFERKESLEGKKDRSSYQLNSLSLNRNFLF
jgi:hypothetical protein